MRRHTWLTLSGIAIVAAGGIAFAAHAEAGQVARSPERSSAHPARHGGNARSLASRPAQAAGAGAHQGQPPGEQGREQVLAARLSIAQLAGQRVIYSYQGLMPPPVLLRLIRHGQVAGVIFFAVNYASRSQFTKAIAMLDAANASRSNPARGYPLLLMTDQEGGLVKRLPGPPYHSEAWIGSRASAGARITQARRAGAGAGADLRSFGLNVNLAPVLDVYRAPGNFDDQYQRSYSQNPRAVSALGAAFVAAQQKAGVAATVKHFPGLGDATARQNTDQRPVTIGLPGATLENVDEYPYRAAIAAGVKLVMVSWAVYPGLHAGRPAGLSPLIVQGQLRHRLGFTGVTITDAIGAGALVHYGPVGNRARLAASAGMDLILASAESPAQGEQCAAALAGLIRSNGLSRASAEASVTSILTLRAGLPG